MRHRLLASALIAMTAVCLGAGCTVTPGAGGALDSYGPGSEAVGAACYDDRDCDPGDYCDPNGGVCVTPGGPVGSVALDGTCNYDAECAPGDVCDDSGVCIADPYAGGGSESSGQPCYDDSDCDSSTYCDLDTDTCF